MNNEFTTIVEYSITFANIPKGYSIETPQEKKMNIEIKTSGLYLLKLHVLSRKPCLTIDVKHMLKNKRKRQGRKFFLTKMLKDEISMQLGSNIQVLDMEPDSMYYMLEPEKIK